MKRPNLPLWDIPRWRNQAQHLNIWATLLELQGQIIALTGIIARAEAVPLSLEARLLHLKRDQLAAEATLRTHQDDFA